MVLADLPREQYQVMQLEHDIVEKCWSLLQVLEQSVAEDEIIFSSYRCRAEGLWESW